MAQCMLHTYTCTYMYKLFYGNMLKLNDWFESNNVIVNHNPFEGLQF